MSSTTMTITADKQLKPKGRKANIWYTWFAYRVHNVYTRVTNTLFSSENLLKLQRTPHTMTMDDWILDCTNEPISQLQSTMTANRSLFVSFVNRHSCCFHSNQIKQMIDLDKQEIEFSQNSTIESIIYARFWSSHLLVIWWTKINGIAIFQFSLFSFVPIITIDLKRLQMIDTKNKISNENKLKFAVCVRQKCRKFSEQKNNSTKECIVWFAATRFFLL